MGNQVRNHYITNLFIYIKKMKIAVASREFINIILYTFPEIYIFYNVFLTRQPCFMKPQIRLIHQLTYI